MNRVPPKTLQKWLGHKLIKTTMNIYVVSPDEFEQEAIKRLDGMCDTQADTPKTWGSDEGAKTLENIGVAEGDRTLGQITIGNDCGNWGGMSYWRKGKEQVIYLLKNVPFPPLKKLTRGGGEPLRIAS